MQPSNVVVEQLAIDPKVHDSELIAWAALVVTIGVTAVFDVFVCDMLDERLEEGGSLGVELTHLSKSHSCHLNCELEKPFVASL